MGALGCRAVSHEGAPGGTYTSGPVLASSSVNLDLRSTNAPGRDVLHHSPSTRCVVRLGYHTCAWRSAEHRCWLRLSQFSRPSRTPLAAPIFRIKAVCQSLRPIYESWGEWP